MDGSPRVPRHGTSDTPRALLTPDIRVPPDGARAAAGYFVMAHAAAHETTDALHWWIQSIPPIKRQLGRPTHPTHPPASNSPPTPTADSAGASGTALAGPARRDPGEADVGGARGRQWIGPSIGRSEEH